MRWCLIIFLFFAGLTGAAAQEETAEEDKGRIVRYLQDALSGLGREVRIDGFKGALSSRVSMDRLTVADADGVWLTLEDAVLDWNRASILRGRINVTQISAGRIDVARLPVSDEPASPEAATGFSLPELPVSIEIKSLLAEEVTLGPDFLGQAITLSVDGAVSLAEGEGQADLTITRRDGPRGVFNLAGSYANATRQLVLDLLLDEAEDGITATLLDLPGRPALELSVKGDAPIDAFVAEIALKSAGEDRLTGRVSTQVVSADANPAVEEQDLPRIVSVDLAGDLAPLFAPAYQPFFGNDVALNSLVQLFPDGRVSLEKLTLQAAALLLEGSLDISADGLPERFELDGLLEDPAQDMVTLPISGPPTKLRRAEIKALFDASEGDAWILRTEIDDLERPDLEIDDATIAASGTIENADGRAVTARLDSGVRGITLSDEALSRALGDAFTLVGDITWREGKPITLQDITLTGEGMALSGSGTVDGLETAILYDGTLEAQVEDIERFSGLAGQPLSGSIDARVKGQAALLTGAFDLDLDATGTDLGAGIEKVDPMLAGESTLSVSAKRDEDGVVLRSATLDTAAVEAAVNGFINSEQTNFEFQTALDDLERLVAGIAGPVELSGEATRHDTGWLIDLDGTGPFQFAAKGRLAVPDGGEPSAKLSGRIGNVSALLPDLPGSAEFVAELRQAGENWNVETTGEGPGGSTFAIAGQVRADASRADLEIDGTLPLALANRRISPNAIQGMAQFDLRLDGPLAVSSITGRLSTSGTRLNLPSVQTTLSDIDTVITLSGSQADIKTNASLATGGRLAVAGQVGTQAPYRTNIGINILDVTLRDPKLFETMARGGLQVTGTAPGNLNIAGQITLDNTEVRVPSTGLGVGHIPEIKHINEPGDVRRTRRVAGLIEDQAEADTSGGIAIGLNVLIAADNRVFVRGRGLDAELGGRFRVTGTTANIIPIGGFDLIRGRLDILGKRLNLDEGSARLQGDFVPGLRLVASTVSDDDTVVRVIIEGRADAPDVSFVSDPSLPEDEILARLLFGRDLGSLSAFQALQLASAVATLAGRGGTSLAERLRESTGLDDLSVTSDGDGETTVGVGKYISDNIYTDVQIGDDQNSEVNLNIDLSRRTKLRGSLGADGGTGLGIFFEKDY
ncbi:MULTISPECIES: translocation/assembly module TamB domain-containing protein [unclassified Roseovarius]|uniref:translocation/assembly module TamB domain-containing protein n=1 Tax=unclassified Roseovarius TaxID=2614913 RepID=UPI00273FDEF8|nr:MULTISPECIES: translocation/assembly module TamB domain-containing protein [unclassified Roseovarius]